MATQKPTVRFDKNKSMQDNVYAMREAGLTNGQIEELTGLPNGRAVRKIYKEACEARGEQFKDARKRSTTKPAPKPAAKKSTAKKSTAKKATTKKPASKTASRKPAAKKAEVDA